MQRLDDKIRAHVAGERPPDHLFRGRGDDRGKKPEPAVHPNVGDVGIPDNVRPARPEASFHQVSADVRFSP